MVSHLGTQQVSMCKVSALIESYHQSVTEVCHKKSSILQPSQFIQFSNPAATREAENQVEFLFNDRQVVFFVSWVMHKLVHE